MRIKCPYSDIYLDLPGDRTDMKFTCPACRRIHRVTISITTPGEDPPRAAANTRSMTRNPPPIPKKYATGAFAPVVDIPIDANFVLLDSRSVAQPGIDLGNAAEASVPGLDDGLAGRPAGPTVMGEEKKETPETPSSPDPAFQPEAPKTEKAAAGNPAAPTFRRAWDEVGEPVIPPTGAFPPAAATRLPDGGGQARRRGKTKSRAGRLALALILLGIGGFLGWQQYRQGRLRRDIGAGLERAESLWRLGDLPAAAAEARAANKTLLREETLPTIANLWNLLAERFAALPPFPDGRADIKARLNAHLERERALESFRERLDLSDPVGTAELLGEAAASERANGAAPMAAAMENLVARLTRQKLQSEAAGLAPEEAIRRADAEAAALAPILPNPGRAGFGEAIDEFKAAQRLRFLDEAEREAAEIAAAAAAGDEAGLDRFLDLERRLADIGDGPELSRALPELADGDDRPALEQLARLARLVDQALTRARSALSRQENDEPDFEELLRQARTENSPHPAMAEAAGRRIEAARGEAGDLLDLRSGLFERMQAEMRRERRSPGTRLAWAMLRIGFADPEVEIDPAGFRHDSRQAAMRFRLRGLPVLMEMGEDDYENRVRAKVAGYDFSAGWSPLFHKPLSWMAGLAKEMRKAGVPAGIGAWEVLEGPGGLLALSRPAGAASDSASASLPPTAGRRAFFAGRLRRVGEPPRPVDANQMAQDFIQAAKRLQEGIMGDESISQKLRQALNPVLMGAFQHPDPQDYFDSSFCRRLLEANYLETFIQPLPPARRDDLDAFRAALGRLEAGQAAFTIDMDDAGRLAAVARPKLEQGGDGGGEREPETGESLPNYSWRWEKDGETVFFSPMPSRFVYAFTLAEHYPGAHGVRPAGRPRLTEVWHAEKGRIASYVSGDDRARGDADLWEQAIADDLSGRLDPTMGPPGWNFPLHVVERDDQGDPQVLATLSGTVKSPDFSGMDDAGERRRAEDAWLASTARTLSTPGELGLIFHQFFRYCSDSPMPELPDLIGSHFGLSDTHQTVYQSLERRWVGRLIGDCDDLAEFFQVLTRLQGKLSHVMLLPSHAACGYVERDEDQYRFIVLQTGPVMQFNAPSLNAAVETAYRSFDRGDAQSHMTTDAVPLLLRFAEEETRTPFVLSARIYEDRDYADAMILVQSYWHENVYSAAIGVMEKMLETDQEIGNIKELGSLYERVGEYARSAELRLRELELVRDNPQAAISTLLELAELHIQDKDREKALAALGEMEKIMREMIRRGDAQEFFQAMTFRSIWAALMARLRQPEQAWSLIQYDAGMTRRQLGRLADPTLRTMTAIYERMRLERDRPGAGRADEAAAREIRQEIEESFGRGYFKGDESYNAIIGRYYFMGRYAVADAGRTRGLALLAQDGPYPAGPRDHTRRSRGVDAEDWKWLRITPQLYLALALDMLDKDDFPELYDPDLAKTLLECVARAVKNGAGLGSDLGGDDVVKAAITLSFLNRDLAAFRRSMAVVKEKNYSSLYDDAAMTFGLQCGLIPPEEFPAWIAVFREFFPGRQHYFKVVYRAIDKGNYDHALLMARATSGYFPDQPLLSQEAEFVGRLIPELKRRRAGLEK